MSDVTLTLPFGHSDRVHVWNSDSEAPEPGDSVPMGYSGMISEDSRGISDPDAVRYLELPATAWGDYDNSGTYDRSNYRSILRDWPQYVVAVYGGYNSNFLAIRIGAEYDEYFLDEILSLQEYPVYDENDLSDLEMELEEEDWESFGRDDFVRGMVQAAEKDLYISDAEVEEVGEIEADDADALFDEASENDCDVRWHSETATGGYFPDLDAKAADAWLILKARMGAGWDEYARSLIPTQPEVLV